MRKRKTHRGYLATSVLITGQSWCGMAASLSFLPLNVKTFWDSVVWFHPGGDKSGQPHPGLRKN